MRYSKSSLLSIALTVGVSAVTLTASLEAQTTTADYPWRAKAKAKTQVNSQAKTPIRPQARVAAHKTDAFVEQVETAFSKPARDLRTVETIATPTPSYESMPSVIYDEGKKYIRQGDTYIESTNLAEAASAGRSAAGNLTQQLPAVAKKTSLFAKTKGLTSRLNPFSTNRASSAYQAKDWKVPSFSRTLPVFSKKSNDPITFAAITPLPAKTSSPSSIDATQPLYAAAETKPAKTITTSPTLSLPARDSQFKSAFPTETKLTSALGGSATNSFASGGFEPNKFQPIRSASAKLSAIESRAEKNVAAGLGNLATEVKTGLNTTGNFISHHGPQISVFENKVSEGHPAPGHERLRCQPITSSGVLNDSKPRQHAAVMGSTHWSRLPLPLNSSVIYNLSCWSDVKSLSQFCYYYRFEQGQAIGNLG